MDGSNKEKIQEIRASRRRNSDATKSANFSPMIKAKDLVSKVDGYCAAAFPP